MLRRFENLNWCDELLRRITLRKSELKRTGHLEHLSRFGTEPSFDFNTEIANDFEINSLYIQVEKLIICQRSYK